MTHDELAERIEALEGACRDMDAVIFKAVGAPLPKAAFGMDIELQPDPNSASGFVMPVGELQVRYECPHYTASLDAAITLVPSQPYPEIRPGQWWWVVEAREGCCDAHVVYENHDAGVPEFSGKAATPALAFCAAALRARSTEPHHRQRRLSMDWQPIETAPEGGLVDVWTDGFGAEPCRVNDCYYDRITGQWRTSRPSGHLTCIPERYCTHWMPVPKAPDA